MHTHVTVVEEPQYKLIPSIYRKYKCMKALNVLQ